MAAELGPVKANSRAQGTRVPGPKRRDGGGFAFCRFAFDGAGIEQNRAAAEAVLQEDGRAAGADEDVGGAA